MNPVIIVSLSLALVATQLIDGKCKTSSDSAGINHAQTHSDAMQETIKPSTCQKGI